MVPLPTSDMTCKVHILNLFSTTLLHQTYTCGPLAGWQFSWVFRSVVLISNYKWAFLFVWHLSRRLCYLFSVSSLLRDRRSSSNCIWSSTMRSFSESSCCTSSILFSCCKRMNFSLNVKTQRKLFKTEVMNIKVEKKTIPVLDGQQLSFQVVTTWTPSLIHFCS